MERCGRRRCVHVPSNAPACCRCAHPCTRRTRGMTRRELPRGCRRYSLTGRMPSRTRGRGQHRRRASHQCTGDHGLLCRLAHSAVQCSEMSVRALPCTAIRAGGASRRKTAATAAATTTAATAARVRAPRPAWLHARATAARRLTHTRFQVRPGEILADRPTVRLQPTRTRACA
jgi:hypothetical protein